MLPQDRGHLARLDPEPADLDLIVEPAEVLEGAVGPAADLVAGPVHPLPRDRDVRHEGPGRGRWVAQVAARHARAGQAHLAGLAIRHRIEAVEHIAADAVDGKPDRGWHRAARQDRSAGHGHRAFGWPVKVDQA